MSVWINATPAAKTAVVTPTPATTSRAAPERSNSTWLRATMYTPAVTIVAAWISADTGVGPSIASGSHTCSGSCADFPHAPSITQNGTNFSICQFPPTNPASLILSNTVVYSTDPNVR